MLVLITGYYAFHTQRMAREMTRARELSAAPNLVASIAFVGQGEAVVRVTNVGQGAALDADLTIEFIPAGESKARSPVRWTPSVVTPFERSDFYAPTDRPRPVIAEFAETFPKVTLTGSVRDSLGNVVDVRDELDVAGYWQHLSETRSVTSYDPAERALNRVAAQLEGTSRALQDLVSIGRGTDFLANFQRSFSQGRPAPKEGEEPPSEES